ncbi:Uncharacterized protein SCF082_LOCUS31467 [Durusdinium trenchii]|uniref:RRM domain-containing protein n=1 Tax=Durusdinium trenchii TaxID=1381693 RepID=A0ABP0N6H1_9DINO
MSALVRITTGIMPQHSRVGMSRAMAQFGEVVHCHKPPYSGIPGEDFVNVRFGTQEAADRAYVALKAGQVFVDGFPVGVGPAGGPKGNDGPMAITNSGGPPRRPRSRSPPRLYGRNRARSPMRGGRSPDARIGGCSSLAHPRCDAAFAGLPGEAPRANFPSRNDPKSPSPRRLLRDMGGRRSRSRSYPRERRREERASEFSGGASNASRLTGQSRVVAFNTISPTQNCSAPFSDDSDKAAGGSSGSSSSEWDEWVADGKKSPFLGPYAPELSQSIGPALAMLVGPVKVPEADPEVKDPGKELNFSKYLPYLQAIWAFGTRGAERSGGGLAMFKEWSSQKSKGEWSMVVKAMYAEEWQGWDDFLGVILPFAQARLVSRLLGLKNQESWYRFVEADPVRLRSLRLPALPAVYYRNDWQGYEECPRAACGFGGATCAEVFSKKRPGFGSQ